MNLPSDCTRDSVHVDFRKDHGRGFRVADVAEILGTHPLVWPHRPSICGSAIPCASAGVIEEASLQKYGFSIVVPEAFNTSGRGQWPRPQICRDEVPESCAACTVLSMKPWIEFFVEAWAGMCWADELEDRIRGTWKFHAVIIMEGPLRISSSTGRLG